MKQVILLLLIRGCAAASPGVLGEEVLELRNAVLHILQGLDRTRVEHLDLTAQRLPTYAASMVDVPRDAPPSVQAVEHVGILEDVLGDAGDRTAEEAPDRGIHHLHLLVRQGHAHRFLELLRRDGLELLLLSPFEDLAKDRRTRYEVPFDLALPRDATLDAVEAVLLLGGHLVVEEAALLEANGAERAVQGQRKSDSTVLSMWRLGRSRSSRAFRSRSSVPGIGHVRLDSSWPPLLQRRHS